MVASARSTPTPANTNRCWRKAGKPTRTIRGSGISISGTGSNGITTARSSAAEDVVHSIDRAKHDPHTAQASNVQPVASAEAIDKYTVKVTTTEPTAPLLDYLFDRLIITGKDLFDKNGCRGRPQGARRLGTLCGQGYCDRPAHGARQEPGRGPESNRENPDHIVFIRIQEDEPRVTALLNGEVQIATAIPPHLAQRVDATSGMKAVGVPSVEIMFLAMNPHFPPWNNKKLRQAAAYAIDREAIVKSVFQGRAEALDGPIGPGQYGYSPDVKPKYPYDPEKAKQLVKDAGFPNGVDVNLFASADRYVNDRQSSEAVAAMLTTVGIRTQLHILDYSIEWPNVRKGLVPFYYQGRGSVIDPSPMLEQYFQSGVTPRIGFSDPKLDDDSPCRASRIRPGAAQSPVATGFRSHPGRSPCRFPVAYRRAVRGFRQGKVQATFGRTDVRHGHCSEIGAV